MKRFLCLVFAAAAVSLWAPKFLQNEVFAAEESAEAVQHYEKATFAGGCFWCVESFFDKTPGVLSTTSGYTGGKTVNPTYEEVSSGQTGHAEAVEIEFDPAVVTYGKILDTFWKNIDPTQVNGQFHDIGTQYRTAVFYHSEEQKREAEAYKKKLQESGKFDQPIVTEIVPASVFYPAEEYHQNYHRKNALSYALYSAASGRETYIKKSKQ